MRGRLMLARRFAGGETGYTEVVVLADLFGASDADLGRKSDCRWWMKGRGRTLTVEVMSAEHTSQIYLTPPSVPLTAVFFLMTPMSCDAARHGANMFTGQVPQPRNVRPARAKTDGGGGRTRSARRNETKQNETGERRHWARDRSPTVRAPEPEDDTTRPGKSWAPPISRHLLTLRSSGFAAKQLARQALLLRHC